jgi:TatD DNase family protein
MRKMILIDSHCHLNFPDFAGKLEHIVKNAQDNDVKIMQAICTNLDEFPQVLAIAEKFDNIFCSVGVHPDNVKNHLEYTIKELLKYTNHPKVIGLGETGLDLYHDKTSLTEQIESFKKHIEVARITGLPLIIHSRDAEAETIDLLSKEIKNGKFTAVIHCFTGSYDFALKMMDLGFYISVSGIVTFKNAKDLQNIIKKLPLDRLLLETDAPYLAPTPYRGKTNEPAFTKYTAQYVADMHEINIAELAEITTRNFYQLFNKAIVN